MNPRQTRQIRAASASAVATFLAAASHTLGGGALPHPLFVVGIAVFLTPVAMLLVGSRPRRLRVALTVAVGQGAFHVLFHALAATGGGRPAGHSHHLDAAALGPVAPLHAEGPAMLFAHAVAAILTTLLLWHGEQLVLTVVRWARAVLPSMPSAPAPAHLPPAVFTDRTPLRRTVARGSISRRGPPAASGGLSTVYLVA